MEELVGFIGPRLSAVCEAPSTKQLKRQTVLNTPVSCSMYAVHNYCPHNRNNQYWVGAALPTIAITCTCLQTRTYKHLELARSAFKKFPMKIIRKKGGRGHFEECITPTPNEGSKHILYNENFNPY